MPDVLVVNASPLIFLGNGGRIDLLRATGAGRIIVPEQVFDDQSVHYWPEEFRHPGPALTK